MTEPKWTPGKVIWRELMTPDLERAKGFYGELFGWSFDTMPMPAGAYVIVKAGAKGVGGMMAMGPEMKLPPMWQSYVSTLDVDAACAAAREHGGSVAWGPVSMPGVGRMATILDFDGAALAVMRPESNEDAPAGRSAAGEFCWETLASSDPDRARTFYAAVCGWKDASGPAGMPVLAAPDGTQVADLQKVQGMPPGFLTYVVVEELQAANARAEKLGGKVLMPRIEVPSVGAFSVIADPLGAVIGLFEG